MDISVIICTWNNSICLSETLGHISRDLRSDAIKWELILVNNNCSDDTDAVVKSYLLKLPIKYLQEPRQGLSRARNKGLQKADGQLVLFADDDVLPCSDWLIAYWKAYQEHRTGFYFGGPSESRFEKCDFDTALLDFAPPSVKGLDFGLKIRIMKSHEYFIGLNWACPLSALKDLKGFDEDRGLNPKTGQVRTGEETDLMNRLNSLGWRGLYLPDAKVRHFVPRSKVTMEHIGSRLESWGIESADSIYHLHEEGIKFLGVPLRMYYSTLIRKNIRWRLKKLIRFPWYADHVSYRKDIGFIKGKIRKSRK